MNVNINFASFSLRLDLKGKRWKSSIILVFILFVFFFFLRGIIKEKKDCLCKAAHHLFIPLAHVTFRDNT